MTDPDVTNCHHSPLTHSPDLTALVRGLARGRFNTAAGTIASSSEGDDKRVDGRVVTLHADECNTSNKRGWQRCAVLESSGLGDAVIVSSSYNLLVKK